jgi:hypothetical protein
MAGRKAFSFVIIVFIVFILLWLFISQKTNDIIIYNETDHVLSKLSITYLYSEKEKVIELPDIPSKDKFKMKMSFPKDFFEGSIILSYTDQQGSKREEYLTGYIENRYLHKNIKVVIHSVDLNGILSIQVK